MTNPEDDSQRIGDRVRREVLGDEHVVRSTAKADPFTLPMQDLVTRYCWGEIWGDDRLPRETRSLLNIVMMVALDRQHELALHTRGALNNGVDAGQIQAALLQALVYCGVPAGMEAFRTVTPVLAESSAATS
jgi:4-carboxymuconolactone decarboxylase